MNSPARQSQVARIAKGCAASKLRFRASVKRIRDYEAPDEGREGKLRLDFNENTLGCSPAVLKALRNVTPEQLAMYPEYENAVRRLADYFEVRPAEMLLTNGVDDALRLLMEVFIEPGDSVLIPEPTFSMYRFFSQVAGARIVSVRYDEAMNFPLEATLRELRRSPHILFIANPNNPTGTLVDEASLARILDAAPRTLVLIDEAYFEFSGLTVLPRIRKRANLIVSRTFSKAAGLAALRLGSLFARADVISAMRRAFTPYPVNSLALTAAEAAVKDEKFLRGYVQDVLESRSQLARVLEQLGARVFPSAANFVLADFGPGGTRLAKRLARRGILVRDRASEFGRDGFIRITAGTVSQTQRLLKAIKEEW